MYHPLWNNFTVLIIYIIDTHITLLSLLEIVILGLIKTTLK